MKHGSGSRMILDCFAASGLDSLQSLRKPIYFSVILGTSTAEFLFQSVCNLKLNISWVMQHNSDQKKNKSGNQQQSVSNRINSTFQNGHISLTSIPLKFYAMI